MDWLWMESILEHWIMENPEEAYEFDRVSMKIIFRIIELGFFIWPKTTIHHTMWDNIWGHLYIIGLMFSNWFYIVCWSNISFKFFQHLNISRFIQSWCISWNWISSWYHPNVIIIYFDGHICSIFHFKYEFWYSQSKNYYCQIV